MFCITGDNKKLYYEEQGNLSSKETLVLLNGLSQSTVAWALMTPMFGSYRIILLDFVFQGQSEKTGEMRDFNVHAADVKKLLDDLKIEKATIAGISYGSLVAQNFAVNHPEKLSKLILISSFAHKTPYFEAIELSWHRSLDHGGYNLMLDVMLPMVLSEHYFAKPLIPIEFMKQARQGTNEDKDALKKLMLATQQREDFRPQLRKIKAPTLVVHGRYDLLLPVHMGEEVFKNIPNAQWRIIDAGHTLNLEAYKELAEMMIEFI